MKSSIIKLNNYYFGTDLPKKHAKKTETMPYNSISFSGGGYNCIYHIGVVKYIFENHNLFRKMKYLGASGGAGISGIILCYENNNNKIKILNNIICEIIEMVSLNLPSYKQVEYYCTIMIKYITEELFNKYIKDTDRCQISVTDITYIIPHNVIKTNFKTYAQYKKFLRASASIPIILDNKIPKIGNRYFMDGGLTNNIPILDERTLKIACINYPIMNADIYPKYICKLIYTIIPPPKKYILDMFDLGYSDIEKYLSKYKHVANIITEENRLNNIISDIINVNDFTN